MRAVLPVLLLATTALAGCSSDPDLDGSTFTSAEVSGHDLVEGTNIELVFEDGQMSAHAGCNTMSGPYEAEDHFLSWTGDIASTLMACEPELEDQDAWLHDLLNEGFGMTHHGSRLTLRAGDVEIVLEED